MKAKPSEKPLGPTEEAKRHGDYIQGRAGRWAVFTNTQINILAKLAAHKCINGRQYAAGLAFERTYVVVWGNASPSRDSTIPPIGGIIHETEQQAERMAKHRARLHTILNRVGPMRYSLLVSVCVYGYRIGRDRGRAAKTFEGLREGLNECAIAYGIQDEEAA